MLLLEFFWKNLLKYKLYVVKFVEHMLKVSHCRHICNYWFIGPILVAARPQACVCSCSLAGISGSNSICGMAYCFL